MKSGFDRIGLALNVAELREHIGWLREGARDVELQDITRPEVLAGDWQAVAREIRELLEGYSGRIGIHGPFWQLSVAPRDPAVRELVQARLNLGLDFAQAIGATQMVIHSPFDFFGHPMSVPGARLGPELERVHQTLEQVVQRAGDQGVTLVVENIYDLSPVPLLELIGSFDLPHVRLSVDVGHAHLMTQRGGPAPQVWLDQAGSLLGHVHLCDNDRTSDQHLAPGEGTIHWPGVLRSLQHVSAEARLVAEVKPPALPGARGWIESLS
ncbi:sugar phosphate isomerase/epimerase family protein [Deinococcus oregonensis]|uniref:Sugar phosphate isomerase/epimerase family protein n=1 Tax=Deinococcus oregonensis TaxID=1805970 RepID=A0ABV6AVR0_9DEIO